MFETRLILHKDLRALRLVRDCPVLRWMFSEPGLLLIVFYFSINNRKYEVFTVLTSFALSLRAGFSHASKFSSSSMSATKMSPFQIHTTHSAYPRNSKKNFLAKLVGSRQVFGRDRIICNHRTKRNYRSFEWFAKSPFIRCFSVQ